MSASTTNNNSQLAISGEPVVADLDWSYLVFQCSKCLSIVGDSCAFLCADNEMKTITLSAVSSVSVSHSIKDLETSTVGLDLGSTFYGFKCANCQTPLGRVYKTTASHLDYIRDYFTFDSDALLTYKLGSYQQIVAPISFPNLQLPTNQDYQRQEAKLSKMQHVLLLFKERLANLESILNEQQQQQQHQHPSLQAPQTSQTSQHQNSPTKDAIMGKNMEDVNGGIHKLDPKTAKTQVKRKRNI